MVQGTGNRDYQARYEVTDLGGSLTTSGIPIHHIDGVKGDVSILATAYGENINTSHGPDGVTMRPVRPQESSYKDIQGNLRARFCRADLDPGGDLGAGGCRERIRQDRLAFRPAPRRRGPPHRLAERAHRGAILARRPRQAAARALHRVRRRPAPPGQRRPPVPDVPRQHGRRDQPVMVRLLHRQPRTIAAATSRTPCSSASPPPCGARAAPRASTSSAGRGRSPTSRSPAGR